MQISCPQCATSYELDDRLLPPGGAPVQCTRCSHVFTAAPPKRDGGKTQIFGLGDLAQPFGNEQAPGVDESAKDPGPPPQIPSGTVSYGQTPSRSTRIFGAVEGQPARSSNTQIFGTATSDAQQPARSSNTQIFGTATSDAQQPARSSNTQIFGAAPKPVKPIPSGTQIFGAPAGRRSTPSNDDAPTLAGGPIPGADSPRSTKLFGAAEAPASAAPRSSTQMFGALPSDHDAPTLIGGQLPDLDALRSTLTERPPQAEPPPASSLPASMFGPPPSSHDAPTLMGGPLPGSDSPPSDSSSHTTDEFSPPAEVNPEPSNPASHGGRRMTGAVARPLEPFSPPAALEDPSIGEFDDLGVALQASRARRRNLVVGALGLAVVVLAGYFGIKAWSGRTRPPPPEAVTAHAQALVQLRRDDAASIQSAADAFAALVKKYPDYLEARASYLTALLFQLDDVRMEIDRMEQRSTQLNAQIARLKEKKSPSDWQNRVNALIDQLGELKKESDPLVDRATALDAQVNTVFSELQSHVPAHPTADQELQLIRAQAVYFGVKGADDAIKLSERYKLKGGTEGWDAVAYAEYALNTKVAPETRRQAREGLEAVKAQDASFVRLHVLIGRLALAEKATDGAANALDAAVTLNPKHEGAQRLLKEIELQKTAQDLR